ncbi:plasma membrane localization protein [Collariella sp. IMI 366227]|nr:plasma membrane localization protein [Collariella sp. IMI 366227]
MNALQQKCRPKHQVLVLKCYPRTAKGAVDVKPNSSELSYLLFYAQSRRSKIQKVGSFLEKKTASDVYRQRIGNVQVTLQILTALIEKTPKDLPLFASCVLQILEQILKSRDITMVESSIPTFEAFCNHHDPASLLGDQAYLRQYLYIVQQYASLASTRAFPGKFEPSKPIALRWRNAGLKAIKSVASSDALSSVTSQQYELAVPMILENLWTDNEDFLDVLHQRAEMEEKLGGALLRRRTSVATVQTAGSEANTNPIALADTAVDMDKLAEEDTGVLAMECLRQIFIATNRSQVHAATVALLKFIQERVSQQEDVVKTDTNGSDNGWAIKMFLLAARWSPVADRFTILVTAMDTLTKQPLSDETLRQHIVLVAMIAALLRSDINLIGLSVMDILLQFIAQIRRLVQIPGDPNSIRNEAPLPGQPDPRFSSGAQFANKADQVSAERKDLLFRLQECIGDLATHVYYADQISDMISTILQKLKPSRTSSTSVSPHGDKSDSTPKSSVHALADEHHVDSLFALTVAKIAALRAIKSVLLVANPRTKRSGNVVLSRSRVPVQVWDGTQWLLRDPDGLVRKAYADAVITWLDRETTSADWKARDETARSALKNRELQGQSLARRAVSSASAREKPVKVPRSQFLQLLHLTIYDNAVQYVDYETDIVLLHCLLAKLVDKRGVNAARYGLPMIFRLQEDIQDAETPIHKVRLGSLVHGYFWILTEKFNFEGSIVGRAIHNEIVRRRSKNFWVEGINIPAPLVDLIGTPGTTRSQLRLPLKEIESEALLPFDERLALVECVCAAYQEQTVSPPQSPAGSPGRSFSHPILGSNLSPIPTIETEHEIPALYREQMVSDWSREAVLAAVQSASKSASLNGSRAGTTGTNRLTANGGLTINGHSLRPDRSSPHGSRTNLRPSSSPSGDTPGSPKGAKLRKSSLRSRHSPPPASPVEPQEQLTSVEQLKLVLSGQLQPPQSMHGGHHTSLLLHPHHQPNQQHAMLLRDGDDSSSDSLVSYDMTPASYPSTRLLLTTPPPSAVAKTVHSTITAPSPGTASPPSPAAHSAPTPPTTTPQQAKRTQKPSPVPPLPTGLALPFPDGGSPRLSKTLFQQQQHDYRPSTATTARRSLKSRGGGRDRSVEQQQRTFSSASWATMDGARRETPSPPPHISSRASNTKLTATAARALHTNPPQPAKVVPVYGTGPPPEPPKPSPEYVDDAAAERGARIARRKRHAEMLKNAGGLKEMMRLQQQQQASEGKKDSKPTPLKRRFWKDVNVREVDAPHPLTSLICRALDIAADDALPTPPSAPPSPPPSSATSTPTPSSASPRPLAGDHDPTKDGLSLRERQEQAYESTVSFLTSRVWPGVSIQPVLDGDMIMPRKQEPGTREVVQGWILALSPFELAGLERATLAGKSLLAAARLVVEWSEEGAHAQQPKSDVAFSPEGEGKKRFGVEEAARAVSLEVSWQTGRWGEVEDTHDVEREDLRRQLGSAVLLVAGNGKGFAPKN